MRVRVKLLGEEFILDTTAPNGGISEWHRLVEFINEEHRPNRPLIEEFFLQELATVGRGWWTLLSYIHPVNFYVDVEVEIMD